jgi:hypothetical protein
VQCTQAWGVLEMRAGNHSLARELFKAALKVDPKNEPTWGTWIAMEDDLGRVDAANELRIRRSEQQWEFVIPASFSTRPEGNSLLGSLLTTLNTFFGRRGQAGAGSSNGSGSSSGGGAEGSGDSLLAQLLPPDFKDDVKLEDMIAGATASQVAGLQEMSMEQLAGGPTAAAAAAASGGSASGVGSMSSSSSSPSATGVFSSAEELDAAQQRRVDRLSSSSLSSRAGRAALSNRPTRRRLPYGVRPPPRPTASVGVLASSDGDAAAGAEAAAATPPLPSSTAAAAGASSSQEEQLVEAGAPSQTGSSS